MNYVHLSHKRLFEQDSKLEHFAVFQENFRNRCNNLQTKKTENH